MKLPYPTTFPTADEESFLHLVLCDDTDFPRLWNTWKNTHHFDDIDFPKMTLLPLVYLRMQKLQMHNDPLFGRIKGIYRNGWVRNQTLIAAAKNFISLCQAHDIPVIILKGLAMITQVYPDVGSRFSGDADVLVDPIYGPRVLEMLLRNGWKPNERMPGKPASSYYIFRTDSMSNGGLAELDVHWNIFEADYGATLLDVILLRPLPMFSFRELSWQDAVPARLGDMDCKRLSNEDLLIHSIVHGSGASPNRELRWIADACTIIRTLRLDWDRVLHRARDYGSIVDVIVACTYLKTIFNAPIPASFMKTVDATDVPHHLIRAYYQKTRSVKRYPFWGNLPLIWYAYWKIEPKKDRHGLFGFLHYACRVWGIPHVSRLPQFILNKYRTRIRAMLGMRDS